MSKRLRQVAVVFIVVVDRPSRVNLGRVSRGQANGTV
jgi:hypothetical protein